MTGLVKSKQVADYLGIPLSALTQMRYSGKFAPSPLKCSGKTCFIYDAEEVKAWVKARCPRKHEWNYSTAVL